MTSSKKEKISKLLIEIKKRKKNRQRKLIIVVSVLVIAILMLLSKCSCDNQVPPMPKKLELVKTPMPRLTRVLPPVIKTEKIKAKHLRPIFEQGNERVQEWLEQFRIQAGARTSRMSVCLGDKPNGAMKWTAYVVHKTGEVQSQNIEALGQTAPFSDEEKKCFTDILTLPAYKFDVKAFNEMSKFTQEKRTGSSVSMVFEF